MCRAASSAFISPSARGHICITSNKTPLYAAYIASSSHPPSLNMKSPLCLLSRKSTREWYCVAHTFREPNKEMARRKDVVGRNTHTRESGVIERLENCLLEWHYDRLHSQTRFSNDPKEMGTISPRFYCEIAGNHSKHDTKTIHAPSNLF